jgi:hypothetical protein
MSRQGRWDEIQTRPYRRPPKRPRPRPAQTHRRLLERLAFRVEAFISLVMRLFRLRSTKKDVWAASVSSPSPHLGRFTDANATDLPDLSDLNIFSGRPRLSKAVYIYTN